MSKRLSKQELIDAVKGRVAESRPKLTKAELDSVVDALWETIRSELVVGNTVPISGFGIFEPKTNGGRAGRNPQTGDAITIAPSKAVKFKLSSSFKAELNGG